MVLKEMVARFFTIGGVGFISSHFMEPFNVVNLGTSSSTDEAAWQAISNMLGK